MTVATTPPHGPDLASLRAQGAELIARDRWPRARLLELQRERLRALLAHAVAASPYYREALGPAACETPLQELPTLPKRTLVEEFDRIVTDPRLRLADLEAHVAGEDAPFLDAYRVFATSGTTGLRGLIVYSLEEFASWVAVSLRLFARLGATPETRLVAIGAPNPLHISKQLFAAFHAGRTGVPELSVVTPLDEMVAELNEYRPEAIATYASTAGLLAQEQLEGRLRIDPRALVVSSEVLTDETRRRIREAWGVTPGQVYASTEVLYLATSTPPATGLDVYEDLVVLEVVDEENRPVPAGEPGYRVLVTNLVNRTQPLIRYELSDAVKLAEDEPAPWQRIAAIDGRSDDILRFPGRAGGEVSVNPYALRAPFAGLDAVRQYQLVHDGGRLEARVVLQPAASPETLARVRTALADELAAAGALPPPVEVVPVGAIEREPGHAAKLKLVKSLVSG